MRGIVHEWWPVATVTMFTLLLVVQIPRKAIFPPAPDDDAPVAFASFVSLDDDAYAAAVQRGRASWQMRSRTQFSGAESRTAAFEFNEPQPAPRKLPVGAEFSARYDAPRPPTAGPSPLLPATLARSGVEGLAEAAMDAAPPRDGDLLALPDSLQEKQQGTHP